MTTRKIALFSILLSIGLVLHLLPSFSFIGMKMDFLLSMMFISILFCDNFTEVVALAFVFGIASALTTSLPGGQIPNIIDKLITAPSFYLMTRMFIKESKSILLPIISFIGTIISGVVFILGLQYLLGMNVDFFLLFNSVVLPTAIGNTLIVQVLYYALQKTKITNTRTVFK